LKLIGHHSARRIVSGTRNVPDVAILVDGSFASPEWAVLEKRSVKNETDRWIIAATEMELEAEQLDRGVRNLPERAAKGEPWPIPSEGTTNQFYAFADVCIAAATNCQRTGPC
jgi:hypothetical protein